MVTQKNTNCNSWKEEGAENWSIWRP